MKLSKRFCSILLVLATLTSCFLFGVSANADTLPAEVTGAAGENVTVTFTTTSCYTTDGEIKYSNINLFEGGNVTAGGSVDKGTIRNDTFILSDPTPMEFKVTLTGKIASNAAVGSYCDITFTYLRTDSIQNGVPSGPEDLVKTVRVKVIEKATPPPSTSSSTTSTTKAPTTTTKAPAKGLDFKALKEQIAAAEALKAEEFTATSWANMEAALKIAKDALGAKKQADIDSATDALKIAIAALVPASTDSAAVLKEMVEEVKKYEEDSKVIASYKALSEALQNAETALASENKEEIEAATAKLKAAFEAFKKEISSLTKTETIEVEKPGEPEGPFCNVRVHKIWLILLIISFILNLLFIALIVYYFINRNKMNQNGEKIPAPKAEKTSDDDSVIM